MSPELAAKIGNATIAFLLWIGTPIMVVVWAFDPSWLRAAMIPAVITITFVVGVGFDSIVEAILRDQGRLRECPSYWEDDEKEAPWLR